MAIYRPFSTHGSIMPECRRPAMKAIVFEWSNGTLSRQSSLTGA
ncbi:hypothetical protein [Sphingomonas sp.]